MVRLASAAWRSVPLIDRVHRTLAITPHVVTILPLGGGHSGEPPMGTVVELFRDAAFDPEAVAVLCVAFEKVQKSLHDTGQPPVVQEVIARRLIACAQRGQCNPDKLAEEALAAIGLRTAS